MKSDNCTYLGLVMAVEKGQLEWGGDCDGYIEVFFDNTVPCSSSFFHTIPTA